MLAHLDNLAGLMAPVLFRDAVRAAHAPGNRQAVVLALVFAGALRAASGIAAGLRSLVFLPVAQVLTTAGPAMIAFQAALVCVTLALLRRGHPAYGRKRAGRWRAGCWRTCLIWGWPSTRVAQSGLWHASSTEVSLRHCDDHVSLQGIMQSSVSCVQGRKQRWPSTMLPCSACCRCALRYLLSVPPSAASAVRPSASPSQSSRCCTLRSPCT